MRRSGIANLKLHGGKAPDWLTERMIKLGKSIMTVIAEEHGTDEILLRLADPFFFQALSNVLGFDWNSSGTTTVLCGVLKTVFTETELGIQGVGGKGKQSRKSPLELEKIADEFSLGEKTLQMLKYSSKMCAKVDNTAIQAGYPLYHHSMFLNEKGKWAVIQQGLNVKMKKARRYHWISEKVRDFVEEPHEGIVGDVLHDRVLDLTSKESRGCRSTITDISKEKPIYTKKLFESLKKGQKTLLNFKTAEASNAIYRVPERMNWSAIERIYELQPENFENLLAIRGVGPTTIRGLALVSEIIFGERPSWKDPVKYCFAFGGKDGVPFPVNREDYDKAIKILEEAVVQSKLGDKESIQAIKRLNQLK